MTVTGTKVGYASATTTSAAKAIPGSRFTTAPTPTISGTVGSGAVLTAQPGTWVPTPTAFSYEWQRDGVVVSTQPTYKVRDADEASSLTVAVTARKAGYETTSRASAPLAVDIPDVLRFTERAIIDEDTDWLMPSVRLVILEEGATVASLSVLRVGPGVTVKFGSEGLLVEGTVRAKGSTSSPAVLTSLNDDTAAGDSNGDGSATTPTSSPGWNGIEVRYGASLDMYKAQVKYGQGISGPGTENDYDAQEWPQLVQIQQSFVDGTVHAYEGGGCWWGECGTVIVSGSTINGNLELPGGADRASNNKIFGEFELRTQFDPADRHAGNVLAGPTKVIRLCASLLSNWSIPTDGTQVVLIGPDSAYCDGGLTVPSGVTLTIPAGVTVRTQPSYHFAFFYDDTPEELQTGPLDTDWNALNVGGKLVSTATSSQPALLTTISGVCNDDDDFSDHWGGVRTSEGSSVDLRNIAQQCVLPHKPFVQSTAPIIKGQPTVGTELSVDDGSWTPAPYALLHTWMRDGEEIPGAVWSTYTVTPDDRGTILTVTTTAYRPGFITTTKRSAPVAVSR